MAEEKKEHLLLQLPQPDVSLRRIDPGRGKVTCWFFVLKDRCGNVKA
jgi:hypothetical protein